VYCQIFSPIASLSLLANCAARTPERQTKHDDVHYGSTLGPHSAQSENCVVVRVLHERKNAKPIKGVQVSIELAYFDGSTRKYEFVDLGKTDKQGMTRYCFNDHLPEWFMLRFYEFSEPAEGELFKPEDVLKHGAVEFKNRGGAKSKSTPSAGPGEIVVVGERWWLVDRWIGPWP
jgi:hypothetical protein